MPKTFSPHFVGWFGVTCPIVVRALDDMPLPDAIKRLPTEYQGKLMARLAWDLAERLKYGIALGLVLSEIPCRDPMENDPQLKGGLIGFFARDRFLDREGKLATEPTQPLLNHFLHTKDRLPAKEKTFSEYYSERHPEEIIFLIQLQKDLFTSIAKQWSDLGIEKVNAKCSIEAESLFSGRNFMLDEGSPYYLRNTDHSWYAEFSRRVINRFSIEAMPRWLSLRDQTNNLLAAECADDLRKLDHHYTALFRRNYSQFNGSVEDYGLQENDAEPSKISGARGTCRLQDDYVLHWFNEKGLDVNPYTRWLCQLVQLRKKSTAVVDWKSLQAKAERYVPANIYEDDESELAQLYWCLSRLNPERYPYSFRFSSMSKTSGEALLHAWWKRVR